MFPGQQYTALTEAIKAALNIIYRAPPITGAEWADEHFYMSAESSYTKGRWKSHPYQIAIINMICNDEIEEFNWIKSKRVGYTKIISITIGYKTSHKARNICVWQPNDSARDAFSKSHMDGMIRDVSVVRDNFPHYGKKHKNNTIDTKVFENQCVLYLRGGKSATNYREISIDDAYYDELSKFDRNIDKEGSPTYLGDGRTDGSVYGKSSRGSTPAIAGECQIEEACNAAQHLFRRMVPCIHCGEHQILEFGGKDVDYGLKWDESLPKEDQAKSVFYCCRHCAGVIKYADYHETMDADGYWESEQGLITYDGMKFYSLTGEIMPTPDTVALHLWAAYSHNSPWSRIVKDWFKAQESREKLQSFVNTTLGETWDDDETEKASHTDLYRRREHYAAQVPDGVNVIVAAIDTQDDRFEIQVDGYGAGEERWTIDYVRLFGDPGRAGIWTKLAELLRRQYKKADGTIMEAKLAVQDHGGHYSDEVNKFSVRMGIRFLIPIKGSSVRNKPVITFPRKPNKNRVYLTEVGSDTAKTLVYQRYGINEPGPGYIHWPINDAFDEDYFKGATAEERRKKYKLGVPYFEWDAKGRRNEPLDCSAYSLAAVRILQQHFLVDLSKQQVAPTIKKPAEKKKQAGLSGRSGSWMRR